MGNDDYSAAKIPESAGDKAFHIITTVCLAILLLLVAYPLYFTVIASVSDLNAILRGEVLLYPKGFQVNSYIRVFQNSRVMTGYRNTILYAFCGTALNLFMTMITGYALSFKFRGREAVLIFILFTMFFGGGLIPTYFLYRNMGIINTVWVMVLPGALSTYNMIVARTFISSIPDELREAAEIDGCSKIRYLFLVVLPLSTVLISVLTLFYVVGHWNAYFNALIFVDNRRLQPLQLVLREILIQNSVPIEEDTMDPDIIDQMRQIKELLKYSLIVVSSLPMIMIYPFLQKFFVKGVLIGSLKG